MPLSTPLPAPNPRPAGRVEAVQLYGGIPPVAKSVWEYGTPRVPPGRDEVPIARGGLCADEIAANRAPIAKHRSPTKIVLESAIIGHSRQQKQLCFLFRQTATKGDRTAHSSGIPNRPASDRVRWEHRSKRCWTIHPIPDRRWRWFRRR